MKRRTFIRAAATLPATAGAAVASIVNPGEAGDTEILRLFREHRRLIDAGRGALRETADDDATLDRLYFDPAAEVERRMMALPSTCAADFAAKVIVDTCRGECLSEWQTGTIWIEARRLTGRPAPS